jgi:hypothetical protein
MDGSTGPPKKRLAKFFGILVLTWFSLGVGSSVVLLGGSNFIPSTEWTAETKLMRIIAGFLSAALFVWAAWRGGKRANMSELKRTIAVLCSPFFGFFMGGNVLFIWPLLLPVFAGQQVELPFTVLRATDSGGRHCRSPVVFEDMPFLVDEVCRVPESIRSSLSPGRRVVARGWGTRLGVYARDLSLTDLK